MKKFVLCIATLSLIMSFVSCGGPSSGKTFVTVGGKKITEGDLELIATVNPKVKPQLASRFGQKKVLDTLVEQELLYLASTKDGLQRDPAVKDKIELYKKVIISQAYMDKALDEAAKKYYEEHKGEYEKLKLSDIMIKFKKDDKDTTTKRTEKDALDLANKIKARLDGGEDFAKVAEETSEDALTSKRGGDLGLASKTEQRLVRRGFAPLLDKAFTMKVGEISGPIKTEDSYNIITITKGSEQQPYEDVSQSIIFQIRADAKNTILEDLKKKYEVVWATEEKPAMEKPAAGPEKVEGQPAQPDGGAPAEGVTPPATEKPADKPAAEGAEKPAVEKSKAEAPAEGAAKPVVEKPAAEKTATPPAKEAKPAPKPAEKAKEEKPAQGN